MSQLLRFQIQDVNQFLCKLSLFAEKHHSVFSILYSGGIKTPLAYEKYEMLAGLGASEIWSAAPGETIPHDMLVHAKDTTLFGHISYEYGRAYYSETQQSTLPVELPDLFWFKPSYRLSLLRNSNEIEIEGEDPLALFTNIQHVSLNEVTPIIKADFTPVMSKKAYLEKVKSIKEDIASGDFYELNFCQAFVATSFLSHPLSVWFELIRSHTVPFAAFLKMDSNYVVSASPERFLLRMGDSLLSQPIKGTIKRGQTKEEDLALKKELLHDPKERAENVMIVDLVRNDLSRICETGSVIVEELMGLYAYPTVHQLISSVSGKLPINCSFSEILESTFPMGSMTGAPKKMVIEKCCYYEPVQRGLYSGSIGYMGPGFDFDLNVVIRSLMVNTQLQKAHYHVGSAITIDSVPDKEYNECLLKADFWRRLFS
jgi:para-aminobenzoate synthetase component 1